MKQAEIIESFNTLISTGQKLAAVKFTLDILNSAATNEKVAIIRGIGLKNSKDLVDEVQDKTNPGKAWLELVKQTYPLHYKNLKHVKQ